MNLPPHHNHWPWDQIDDALLSIKSEQSPSHVNIPPTSIARFEPRSTSTLIFVLDEELLDGDVLNCNEMAIAYFSSWSTSTCASHPKLVLAHLETSPPSTPKTTLHGGIGIL